MSLLPRKMVIFKCPRLKGSFTGLPRLKTGTSSATSKERIKRTTYVMPILRQRIHGQETLRCSLVFLSRDDLNVRIVKFRLHHVLSARMSAKRDVRADGDRTLEQVRLVVWLRRIHLQRRRLITRECYQRSQFALVFISKSTCLRQLTQFFL